MSRGKKPGVDPTQPGYFTVGRVRRYQLDPRWDEMTSYQRAYIEDLETDEERDEYMDAIELEGDDCLEDDYSEDSDAE